MKTEELIFQELEKEKRGREATAAQGFNAPHTPARFMISGDAPIVMEKACEFFVKELSLRAWTHTERNRRRTVQRSDVHSAVGESEMFDFLIDIVPRVLPPQVPPEGMKPPAGGTHSEAASSVDEQSQDGAMKVSDAETRYGQLQEMQSQMHEHYSLMQQRAQAEGTLPLSGLPALSDPQEQPQVVLNPQLVIHPPNGTAMPQWQPAGPTGTDETTNDSLSHPALDL